MFVFILLIVFLVLFLSIYYYFERRYTKNERKKYSKQEDIDSLNELSQKKRKFLFNMRFGMIIIFGVIYLVAYLNPNESEWYLTEDETITNVDPEFEKRKLEEYNLFKEDAILLGRWEPADSSITDAKYRWGRSDILIYKKNELYFIEYENTGFAKNYIEQGIPAPNGNVIIFTTYHFFYPESLTFKDDTYIRKD